MLSLTLNNLFISRFL